MKRQKRAVTLIEMMIVIVLIGLIGGALAFNMRGSMDKGRIFKTEQNIARVYDALMLEQARTDLSLTKIIAKKDEILDNCSFVKDGKKLLKDAWGRNLKIVVKDDDLLITSTKLEEWNEKRAYQ